MAEVIAGTDRLRLRTWDAQDRVDFVRHLNTPAVMRWLGGVRDEAQCTAVLDRLEALQREFGHTFWAVEHKSDEALLGFCGLIRVDSPGAGTITGDFEIGWRLRQDVWGRGYAKEAAIASLDLAFDRYGAPHVVALTVAGNAPSQALMERLGMTRRSDLDFWDTSCGEDLNPTIVYRIEAPEWPAARERVVKPR